MDISETVEGQGVGDDDVEIVLPCPTTIFSCPGFHLMGSKCQVAFGADGEVNSFSIPICMRSCRKRRV